MKSRNVVALVLLFECCVLIAGCTLGGREKEEPSTMITLRGDDGRTLTPQELRDYTGTFRYEILGSDDVPANATTLHQQAREAGGRGEYDLAIDLLTQASDLAPRWPYPVYDKAFTYLLMNDFEAARAHYEKTVALAPRGFFTAITALDILTREKKGEFAPGIYLAYVSLEWMTNPSEKERILRELVARAPSFAPGWEGLANFAEEDSERLAHIEKGLAAEPDAETMGMLQISKALVLKSQGDVDEAVQILEELILDPRSTLATEHLAESIMVMVTNE